MEEEQVGALALMGVMGLVGIVFLVVLALHVLICWLLYNDYKRIPEQFRKLQPGLVWLLLIPCFSLVWNFFVYPKLSESFKAYFESAGQTDVGDAGSGLAWAYAICAACSIVPYLGALAGLAALVLLIIYLIKANELKNRIPLQG